MKVLNESIKITNGFLILFHSPIMSEFENEFRLLGHVFFGGVGHLLFNSIKEK